MGCCLSCVSPSAEELNGPHGARLLAVHEHSKQSGQYRWNVAYWTVRRAIRADSWYQNESCCVYIHGFNVVAMTLDASAFKWKQYDYKLHTLLTKLFEHPQKEFITWERLVFLCNANSQALLLKWDMGMGSMEQFWK
eukprot:TRINITY_DN5511_c0_g1_i1.p1 TRINITY_DN5511_c0_g1~~TRINITY_DN5511_c0_g1_i1.p1  ORF type:complete len:137 (+),score=20.03 TRINITY_DN5511_c0_g1_i1:27-437(+)